MVSRRAERSTERQFSLGVWLLWTVFAGTLVYSLVFTPWLAITEIDIAGESVVPADELRASLDQLLSGTTLFVFPKRHLLFLPEQTIRDTWLARYPKFKTVNIERLFPHALRVTVSERPILVRWCSGGPCVQVDEKGRTSPDAPLEQPAYQPHLFSVIEKNATPVTLGETLPVLSTVATIEVLARDFPLIIGLGFEPVMETPTRHAEEIRLRTSAGWDLLLSTRVPATESIRILQRLLDESVVPEKFPTLLSIDLRTAGRAFIAYRQGDRVTVDTSSESDKATRPSSDKKKKR